MSVAAEADGLAGGLVEVSQSEWPSEQSTRKFVTCPAQTSPVQAISELDEISKGMETTRDAPHLAGAASQSMFRQPTICSMNEGPYCRMNACSNTETCKTDSKGLRTGTCPRYRLCQLGRWAVLLIASRRKVLGSFCSAIRIAIASEPPLRARVCAAPQGTRPKAQHQKLGCHEKWLQSPQPTMARPTFFDLKPQ